jgi:hypothetical protein
MGRDTLTTQPPERDYLLGTTGLSWNVRRSDGIGGCFSVSEGNRDKSAAVTKALSLGEADRTDVWETVGNGMFRRLGRFRPV